MKSTHPFQVKAPIDSIYDNVLAAERWLSFVPGYRGLVSGDPEWPNEGSSIIVRFGLSPRVAWDQKVTVVEHERGHRFVAHEDVSSGLYVDKVDFTFEADNGTTKITLIRDVTSRSILLRILMLLAYPLTRPLLARAFKRRFSAMVET